MGVCDFDTDILSYTMISIYFALTHGSVVHDSHHGVERHDTVPEPVLYPFAAM